MLEELEAGDIAKTDGGVIQSAKVNIRSGINEEVAKGFVGITVGAEGCSCFKMAAVGFCDLGSCKVSMIRLGWRIRWRIKGNAGNGDIFCWRNCQGKVAMAAAATVGVDGGSIAVELCLGNADGCIVGS